MSKGVAVVQHEGWIGSRPATVDELLVAFNIEHQRVQDSAIDLVEDAMVAASKASGIRKQGKPKTAAQIKQELENSSDD